jgi:hypothetical protein
MRLAVEFLDGRPVSVFFPDVLELKDTDTAPPTHQQADSNFKTAKLGFTQPQVAVLKMPSRRPPRNGLFSTL